MTELYREHTKVHYTVNIDYNSVHKATSLNSDLAIVIHSLMISVKDKKDKDARIVEAFDWGNKPRLCPPFEIYPVLPMEIDHIFVSKIVQSGILPLIVINGDSERGVDLFRVRSLTNINICTMTEFAVTTKTCSQL